MPKEVIHDEGDKFDLVVTWSPDQYMQIGIVTRDGRSINEVLSDGLTEREELPNYEGLWITPNRHQVNRTVQVIRRARNQVFGADE